LDNLNIDFEECLAVTVKKINLTQSKLDGVSLGIMARRLSRTILHVEPLRVEPFHLGPLFCRRWRSLHKNPL
jgi:hypothetical protein